MDDAVDLGGSFKQTGLDMDKRFTERRSYARQTFKDQVRAVAEEEGVSVFAIDKEELHHDAVSIVDFLSWAWEVVGKPGIRILPTREEVFAWPITERLDSLTALLLLSPSQFEQVTARILVDLGYGNVWEVGGPWGRYRMPQRGWGEGAGSVSQPGSSSGKDELTANQVDEAPRGTRPVPLAASMRKA